MVAAVGVAKTELTDHSKLAGIRWRALGASIRGASHDSMGLPNQDAISFEPASDQSSPHAIVAVSDGHGDPTCFRSAAGSAFAVATAHRVLDGFRVVRAKQPGHAPDTVVRELLAMWRRCVDDDLVAHPFYDKEFVAAEQRYGARVREQIAANPRLAYGATLVAVLVTMEYCLYAQIGDGDILRFDSNGVTRRIFASESHVTTNETFSLCLPDAERRFRMKIEANGASPPALVLAASDGYANSYGREDDFLQIARDYHALISEHGAADVHAQLENFLRDASIAGSRDDITLGIVSRVGAVPAPSVTNPEETLSAGGPSRQARPLERSWLIVLAVVVMVGVLLALAHQLTHRTETPVHAARSACASPLGTERLARPMLLSSIRRNAARLD